MKSRLAWMLHRRRVLENQIPGFHADVRSYADLACVFSPYNTIQRNTILTNVHLGPFSYVAANTKCSECRIGSFSSIGPDGLIGGLGRHPTRWLSTHPAFYSTKRRAGAHLANRDRYDEFVLTEIGSDVFIGARAIVLDGVRIGHGAIIAAGAVVARDVAPFAVVAGTPAAVVRLRFDDAVIEALLDWKWWDLPLEQLKRVHELFTARTDWCAGDVEEIRRTLRGS